MGETAGDGAVTAADGAKSGGGGSTKVSAGGILNINRDNEILQRFVRVNLEEGDETDGGGKRANVGGNGGHGGGKRHQKGAAPGAKHDSHSLPPILKKHESVDMRIPEEPIGKYQPRESSLEVGILKNLSRELRTDTKGSKRFRKRGIRYEECYTDKDRAAAVNMGSRDIKHSLKIKRKQDRSKALQIPEEACPATFLALGKYELCRGDPDIAIDFISKALELNPTEKKALVARSKCYILLGQPNLGLKDAETALSLDKNCTKALYQKAESLYYLGDFEHSLMYYHRGLRVRPEHEGFKLGVQKAQKAIENAIGSSFPGINQICGSKNATPKSSHRCTPVSRNSNKDDTGGYTSSKSTERTPTPKNAKNSMSTNPTPVSRCSKSAKKSKLLRELGVDKEYLDNLLKHPDLICKNQEDTKVKSYIKEAIDFLEARQEFWRQQLPPKFK